MTPVIPCSISNVAIIPGTTFLSRKNYRYIKCSLLEKFTKQTISTERFLLPLSISVQLSSKYRSGFVFQHGKRGHILAATGTEVTVEEPGSILEDADRLPEVSSDSIEESEETSSIPKSSVTPDSQSKRSRPIRKSVMPPVKDEELVPGATFTGKVRSIQPFGAFVDFGAFTDGLVHVSRLSDTFVKEVGSIVSVGQEVKVRLVEANTETGRISLTMRDSDDIGKLKQQRDAPSSDDNPRTSKRNASKSKQKSSKFVKGQDLEGSVKNLTRAGAFISLPEGEEGFLPTAEESDEGFGNFMGGSSLQVGQEVSVRVLRISRGQVTLTMKKEEDVADLNSKLTQGVVHTATNPFLLAFRKNKDISMFLDEREEVQKQAEISVIPKVPEEKESKVTSADNEEVVASSVVVEAVEIKEFEKEVEAPSTELVSDEEIPESTISNSPLEKEVEASSVVVEAVEIKELEKEVEAPSTELVSDEETPESTISNSPLEKKVEASDTTVEPSSSEFSSEEEIHENPVLNSSQVVETINETIEEAISKTLTPEGSVSSESLITEEISITDVISESVPSEEVVVGQSDDSVVKDEVEIPSALPKEDGTVASIAEENVTVTTSSGVEDPPKESTTKATISPSLVKKLREETGAGMMDCKKALAETGGDIVKAQEFLRKKGLANADKKASRATAEGRIGSYIHDSRIGVLIEVNCETDFVSRGEIFKELVDDLAMQVAACPQVRYLVTEDVSEDIVNKEREIEMQKEDLLSKPEQIREKIVEGRIRKRLEELALLEQPYIKNDKVVVKDWVKQTIASIGENIKVKRFVRFNLGEGLEKRSQDFAAEVAAQTAAKASPAAPLKDQPASVETEDIEKPTVTVSAALVKQLREETGAGMMDCKKALTETGGNLEKAQEYLRKKGLSTADKKSSRIAAEGRIGTYIHDSRIGVLIEVNSETDFVGRSEKFKELVDDLAMQVVACPQVEFVSIEEIPESIVSKERELEMQREDLMLKPVNIREKIVEGRISKRLGELALLEQPFIKNDSLLVKDLVKQTVAALGENIKVRRFVRFTLGE